MGLDAKAGFVGLVTATGEVSSDRGALRIADNVTLRKAGALMLRALFSSSALSRAYKAAFPYKGSLYYIGGSNVIYNNAQTQLLEWPASTATPALRDDVQSAKESRGNLYFAASTGVFKVSALASAAVYPAGTRPTEIVLQILNFDTSGSPLLQTTQQAAYRIVTVRTDVNGVITRSRPTGALTVAPVGSAASPILSFFSSWPADPTSVSRKIEVYRSRVFPTTAQVDDEMQLIATLDATAGMPPSFTDRVPDVQRGTTLYTSPSRGGMENAADRPPGCACIERYRGSLFFGNIAGPHRIAFSFNYDGQRNGQTTLIGQRQTTGNLTNGSSAITSVANVTGIQAGMAVSSAAGGADLGRVTSVVGSTVNVAFAASVTAAGTALYFNDAFTIDNGLKAVMLGSVAPPVGVSWPNYTTSMNLALQSAYSTDYTAYEVTPPNPGYEQTVVLERVARGGAAFQLRASRGNEVSPAIPLGDAATGLPSTNDLIPNGLAWSEPDEPEHVPPKNFARVGDAGRAILALVATRDRLLIFKEDGLFMLTGDTAANFGLYPLDTTCLCILPGSVRRLQNTVYALTNLGLVAVDENGGVTVVSRAIQTELAPIVTQIRQAQKASGLYLMPGLTGITGTNDDPNGEYWLALGTTTPSFGGQVLVWNAFQGGFTTYSFGATTPVALSADGEGQPLVLAATSLLTPSTGLGAITARISPHAFSDPALLGKMWTHIVTGFSRLTGTTSITATFTSSESMLEGASITETVEAPTTAGLIQAPLGTLLRHLAPNAVKRAYLAFVELTIAVASGTFTLELIGTEARENIPNKRPTHGTGGT